MNSNNSIIIDENGEEATDELKQQFEHPVKVERRGKNIVLTQNGIVIGTLSGAKKLSYGKGIQDRFQEKRRQAYIAKQAKQQQATNE
jgi:hypothetical protein